MTTVLKATYWTSDVATLIHEWDVERVCLLVSI